MFKPQMQGSTKNLLEDFGPDLVEKNKHVKFPVEKKHSEIEIREKIESTPELDKAVENMKLLLAKCIAKRFSKNKENKSKEEKKVVVRKTSTCYILQEKDEYKSTQKLKAVTEKPSPSGRKKKVHVRQATREDSFDSLSSISAKEKA